jgi:tRNA (Thr-GGU) A37 N-methylase
MLILFYHSDVDVGSLEGIDEYDYIWVTFLFHENTNTSAMMADIKKERDNEEEREREREDLEKGGVRMKTKEAGKVKRRGENSNRFPHTKAKVYPPRLSGREWGREEANERERKRDDERGRQWYCGVGVLATRSPHRYNPIGLSLFRLEGIVRCSKDGAHFGAWDPNTPRDSRLSRLALVVTGVDLLDGTPILDIKPYIPLYDSLTSSRVPLWVKDEHTNDLFSVEFAPSAAETLMKAISDGRLEMYGVHTHCPYRYLSHPSLPNPNIHPVTPSSRLHGTESTSPLENGCDSFDVNFEYECAKKAISDVIKMDIRSHSQKRRSGPEASTPPTASSPVASSPVVIPSHPYSFLFDTLRVSVWYCGDGVCLVKDISLST